MVTQGVRDPGAAAPSGFSNSAEAPCGQYEPPAMLRGSGDTEKRTEVSSNAAEEGVRRPQHPSWTSEVALPPGSGERGTQSRTRPAAGESRTVCHLATYHGPSRPYLRGVLETLPARSD